MFSIPLVFCTHCCSGPLFPLFLCAHCSSVHAVPLVFCSHSTSRFDIYILIISHSRAQFMRDYPFSGKGQRPCDVKEICVPAQEKFAAEGYVYHMLLSFTNDCFTRSVHVKGSERRSKPGSVPNIWKKASFSLSERSRRWVSKFAEFFSRSMVVTSLVLFLNLKRHIP